MVMQVHLTERLAVSAILDKLVSVVRVSVATLESIRTADSVNFVLKDPSQLLLVRLNVLNADPGRMAVLKEHQLTQLA